MAVSLHGLVLPSVVELRLIDIAIHQSPQVNGSSRKAVRPQPDEARLLRSNHQNLDQGAVPVVCALIYSVLSSLLSDDIQMPSQKKIPRGFEIKNSLCPASKSKAPPLAFGANNSLELTPVHGDNLTHTGCNDYPSKRRKIANSQTPPEVEEISPPRFDPRESQDYRITRSDRYQGTDPEKENRRVLNNGHSSRSSTSVDQSGSVREFGNVEKMMKPSKNSYRVKKFSRLDQSQNLPDVDSLNLTIGVEQQIGKRMTGSKYRGTARAIAQNPSYSTSPKIRLDGLHENVECSPYSINQSHCLQQPADLHASQGVPSIKRQRRASNQDGTLRRTRCLNKDFVPYDADLSGDELLGATTVGSNAGSHPSPPSNISYQDKGTEDLSTQEIASIIVPGLPPSIIPSSFNKTKIPINNSNLPAAKSGEKERRWAIDLKYANAGKIFEGDALGLVFDEKTECYHVYCDGQNLTATNPGYIIQPKKLREVLFREAWVRFHSSKTGHAENVLDIRSNSARDVLGLLNRLTENSGIQPKFTEKLERMFSNRVKLQEKQVYCIDDTTEESRKAWDLVSTPCQSNNIQSKRLQDEIAIKQRPRLREKLEPSSEALAQPRYRKILGAKSELVTMADAKNRGTARESPIRKLPLNPPNPYIASGFESEIESIHVQSPPTGDSSAHPRVSINEDSLASAWHSRPLASPGSTPVEWRDLLEVRDLERLEDGEYLNDNLIEFYLKYLKIQLEQTSPETAKKVYFFNTFFFASLTRKGKKGINYDAVQKWTRSIDIFSYDYVVVPICEAQHWYVAIICNLPTLFKDRGIGETLPEDEPPQGQFDSSRDHRVELPAGSSDHRFGQTLALSVGELESSIRERDAPIEQYPSKSFEDLSLEPCHGKPPELEAEPCAAQATNVHSDSGPSDQRLPDTQAEKQVVQTAVHEETDSKPIELREKVISEGCNLKAPTDKRKKQRTAPARPRNNPNIPLIITFDSLGLAHSHTNKVLKDYLAAEGKAKRAIDLDISQLKGITAKDIPLQENYSDCGLFLLGYIAKFLEGPKEFISRVIGHSYFNEDWATLIPGNLRAKIRAQIRTLLSDQARKERDSIAEADWRHSQERHVSEESSLHPTHPEEQPVQAKHAEQASRTVLAPTRSPRMESPPLDGSLVQGTELYRMNGHAREPSPPQPGMKALHMTFIPEGHLHDAVSPTQNIAPGKDRFFENALSTHETETWQPSNVDTNYSTQRRGAQLSQDSPDPLHEPVIFVRGDSSTPQLGNPTPPPQESPSISSEIHSSSLKYAEDSEQHSKYFSHDPDASIDRHTIIQDSQPSSVVDPQENQETHQELTPRGKPSTRSAPIYVEID